MSKENEKKRIMISLSQEVFEKIEDISKETGLSKSALITMWINEKKA
ncbi:transcriptional regulator [Staphylococcus casei]|nr:transcriptional regulator [Staphylococcus equorum]MDN6292364.1 transcriptional regulator [Tetragenococcus halophilus]PNZ57468.1 transcriptional regulator [Staphylococcus casei]